MVKDYMAPVIPGLVLAFLAIVFGTVAGMAFGVIEDDIKGYYLSEVKAHPAIHKQTPENIKKQVHDSWRYTQRAHFHAQGLGALGVGIILALAFSSAFCAKMAEPRCRKRSVAVSFLLADCRASHCVDGKACRQSLGRLAGLY